MLRIASKQVWMLLWYALAGLVENAVFGWGDAKLGITEDTVDRAIRLLKEWGIPALTVIAFLCCYYALEFFWFTKWRTARISARPSTPENQISPTRPEDDEFVSMTEAATKAYEQSRESGSLWAYAAERLGARGMNRQSSENEILNYMASFVSGKIPLYGVRPPSRLVEQIEDADKRNGIFENNASEFRFLLGKSPTYANLKVKKIDLETVLEYIKQSHKTEAHI